MCSHLSPVSPVKTYRACQRASSVASLPAPIRLARDPSSPRSSPAILSAPLVPDSEKTKLQVGDRIYVNPGVTASDEDVKSASKSKGGKGKKGRKSDGQRAQGSERWLARIEQIRALNKVDVYLCVLPPASGALSSAALPRRRVR
jgi:hypothetical protein